MTSARTTVQRRDWRQRALCRDEDPELFFPISSKGPSAGQIAAAKAVCARCGVRTECLEFALASGQTHGVWGGTTLEERRAIRRRHDGSRPARDPVAAAAGL